MHDLFALLSDSIDQILLNTAPSIHRHSLTHLAHRKTESVVSANRFPKNKINLKKCHFDSKNTKMGVFLLNISSSYSFHTLNAQ